MFNEGNQIHNFMSSSGSGSVINYGSGSEFLTSYSSGSGSKSQKVTVPTVPVPVPHHCINSSFAICRGLSCILIAYSLSKRITSMGCRAENRSRACLSCELMTKTIYGSVRTNRRTDIQYVNLQ